MNDDINQLQVDPLQTEQRQVVPQLGAGSVQVMVQSFVGG